MWKRSKVFIINTYRLTYYRYNLIKYDWSKAWDRWWRGDPRQCVQGSAGVSGSKPAQVPFMITKSMKSQLLALDYNKQQIHKLTPLQAHNIIKQQLHSQEYGRIMGDVSQAIGQTNETTGINQQSEAPSIDNVCEAPNNMNNVISRSTSISEQVQDKLSEGSITVCAASELALDNRPAVSEQPAEQPLVIQAISAVQQSAEILDNSPAGQPASHSVNKATEEYLSLCVAPEEQAESVSSIVLIEDQCEDLFTPQPAASVTKVPFFITKRMKLQLLERGYSEGEINSLAPSQAHEILNTKPESPSGSRGLEHSN